MKQLVVGANSGTGGGDHKRYLQQRETVVNDFNAELWLVHWAAVRCVRTKIDQHEVEVLLRIHGELQSVAGRKGRVKHPQHRPHSGTACG